MRGESYNQGMTIAHTTDDTLKMLQDIIQQYEKYGDKNETPRIQSAYEFAQKAHQGIARKS